VTVDDVAAESGGERRTLDAQDQRAARRGPAIARLTVAPRDAAAVRLLADRVISDADGRPLDTQLMRLAVLCHELPTAVRESLVELRLSESRPGGLVLSGLSVDDDALCDTPASGALTEHNDEVARADAMTMLVASFLGDPISHADIEDGRLIRDVCAQRGYEHKQLATSSAGELTFHNEDAYHELRADWVLLMCLRNPERAATSFVRMADVEIPEDVKPILFERRFPVELDSSHPIDSQRPPNRQVAVLSGHPQAPFVCLDPEFMPRDLADEDARRALDVVVRRVEDSLCDVVLAPGDLFVIDNLRSVHGRRPFAATYSTKGRWLRTLHATADLRRSEGRRTGSHGRAILAQV
jgi:Fe(II)/alpha-ketoglutarate-dependent arginine beta-hydroxylase